MPKAISASEEQGLTFSHVEVGKDRPSEKCQSNLSHAHPHVCTRERGNEQVEEEKGQTQRRGNQRGGGEGSGGVRGESVGLCLIWPFVVRVSPLFVDQGDLELLRDVEESEEEMAVECSVEGEEIPAAEVHELNRKVFESLG